ncbi:MAG: hypothetical protein WC506_04480 [Candidatus Micrarchaeia archaeon]
MVKCVEARPANSFSRIALARMYVSPGEDRRMKIAIAACKKSLERSQAFSGLEKEKKEEIAAKAAKEIYSKVANVQAERRSAWSNFAWNVGFGVFSFCATSVGGGIAFNLAKKVASLDWNGIEHVFAGIWGIGISLGIGLVGAVGAFGIIHAVRELGTEAIPDLFNFRKIRELPAKAMAIVGEAASSASS